MVCNACKGSGYMIDMACPRCRGLGRIAEE